MALTKIKTSGIADNAITNAKMADDAIDSADLADGSIDNAHLAGSIAVSKTLLAGGTGLTLSTNTLAVDAAQTQITSVGTLTGLTLSGDATLSAQLKLAGGSASRLYFNDRLGLEGATNGSAVFVGEGFTTTYIKSTNMGIGVESPAVLLHLDSDATSELRIDSSAHSLVSLYSGSTQKALVGWDNNNSELKLVVGTDGLASEETGLKISNTGNATFSGNASFAGNITMNATHASTRSSGLHLDSTAGHNWYIHPDSNGNMGFNYNDSASDALLLDANLNATFGGSIISSGGSAGDNTLYKHSNNYLYLLGGSAGLVLKGKNSDDALIAMYNGDQKIAFNTNNAERLKLENSGATFSGTITTPGVQRTMVIDHKVYGSVDYGAEHRTGLQNDQQTIPLLPGYTIRKVLIPTATNRTAYSWDWELCKHDEYATEVVISSGTVNNSGNAWPEMDVTDYTIENEQRVYFRISNVSTTGGTYGYMYGWRVEYTTPTGM